MYAEKLEVLHSSYVDVYKKQYGYIIPILLYIRRTLNRLIYSANFGGGMEIFLGVIVITLS